MCFVSPDYLTLDKCSVDMWDVVAIAQIVDYIAEINTHRNQFKILIIKNDVCLIIKSFGLVRNRYIL